MKPNFHSIKYPSLGTQLLGLGGGIVLLLALAFTWFNTQTQREELQDVFTKQARALAFNLAVSSSSHLLERDFSVIENLLLKTDGFEDLHSGTVLDPTGHILAQVIRDQESRRLKAHYNSQTMMLGTSLHTLVQMVDNGLGLTIIPEMAVAAGLLNGTDVQARPLNADHATREIALIWRTNSPRREEFELLAESLRELHTT